MCLRLCWLSLHILVSFLNSSFPGDSAPRLMQCVFPLVLKSWLIPHNRWGTFFQHWNESWPVQSSTKGRWSSGENRPGLVASHEKCSKLYQAWDLPPSSSLHRPPQSLQVSTNVLVIRKHQCILTLTWDIYKWKISLIFEAYSGKARRKKTTQYAG